MEKETQVKPTRFTLLSTLVANRIKGGAKPAKKINPKILNQLEDKELKALAIDAKESGTQYNSIQYHINSLDWEIKKLIHKDNVKSIKVDAVITVITLVSGFRITVSLCGVKGSGAKTLYKHHYRITDKRRRCILDVKRFANPIELKAQLN